MKEFKIHNKTISIKKILGINIRTTKQKSDYLIFYHRRKRQNEKFQRKERGIQVKSQFRAR